MSKELETQITELQSQLQTANAALEAEQLAHAETKQVSLDMITQLQAQSELATKAAGGNAPVTVTVEGEEYLVTAGVKIGHKKYSILELAANKKLCADLIENSCGVFVPVKAGEGVGAAPGAKKAKSAERQGGRNRDKKGDTE